MIGTVSPVLVNSKELEFEQFSKDSDINVNVDYSNENGVTSAGAESLVSCTELNDYDWFGDTFAVMILYLMAILFFKEIKNYKILRLKSEKRGLERDVKSFRSELGSAREDISYYNALLLNKMDECAFYFEISRHLERLSANDYNDTAKIMLNRTLGRLIDEVENYKIQIENSN